MRIVIVKKLIRSLYEYLKGKDIFKRKMFEF